MTRVNHRAYVARKGAVITDEQAKVLGREMDAMERAKIPVTPAALIERVQDEGHPLHGLFEWDDAEAAIQWRLAQARRYIAEVEIVVKPDTGERGRARLSVVVMDGEESRRSYETRRLIEADDEKLQQVSVALYARVCSALREARSLGLTRDGAWQRIDDAVSRNEPQAVVQIGGLQEVVARA